MRYMNKQTGFSAVLAVILILLFGLIGTYMLSLTSVSSISTTLSAGAMQAWFASRSGVQWAVHQALDSGTCVGVDSQVINFTSAGLNGFQANINCTETAVTEGGTNYDIYAIIVAGSRGAPGDLAHVSRTISVTITDRNAP